MADSSAIANALIAALNADAPLRVLMPDGVHEDVAPTGAKQFVIVSQIISRDVATFGRRAYEDALYLVEARALSTTPGNPGAAAARIDALLNDGALSVAGYGLMVMHRVEFVRGMEADDVDPSIRWRRRGGQYRVQVAVV